MPRKIGPQQGSGGPVGSHEKPDQAPLSRPAITSPATDAESGDDGTDVSADLRALKVMLDRGLMTQKEYDDRRSALLAGR